jgi:predicted alpha-1,6-mannanase (GH76 family)
MQRYPAHLPCPTGAFLPPRQPTWTFIGATAVAALLVVGACGGSEAAGQASAQPGASPAAAGIAGTAAPASATTAPAGDPVAAEAGRRADAAMGALVDRFWRPADGAFTVAPHGDAAAEYWIAAQAFDTVLDGVERTGNPAWKEVARGFVAAQDRRGWTRDFFDDENWMALALLRHADLSGDAAARARAEALLADIESAWDDTCCGAHPGGVWWNRAHTQKATASNAGAVITAARVYERGGDPRHLAFARKAFAYWLSEMVDPSTGQVADHVEPDGSKVWWRFTYNEGAMIGAALALYRVTGEATYLDAARRVGSFVLAHETVTTSYGGALSDGPRCDGDCEQFKGIAQRYLAGLAAADPQGPWRGLVGADADAIWNVARDPATTTFGVDWAGRPTAATVATQSSATMALERAARSPTR